MTRSGEMRIESLEVVAVPGHEGDQHVLAQRELAQVGRAVGNDVPGGHLVTALHDGALVDVGVLLERWYLMRL